ncbi:MAG: radical SAM protein [Planctomycetes bacterium]|nr:radical SAM protein [Planctomycetota bacterium]
MEVIKGTIVKINHDIVCKSTVLKKIKMLMMQRSVPAYIRNRIEWHYYPRLSILRQYPIHIDIELSSYCQLKCPMCFRFHRPIEKQGNMRFDIFKKIIDEISGRVYSIKFTGRGEPLINNEFPKFIEYLKDKQFGEIAIITNGQLMDEEKMRCMIDNSIDRVALSIDGLREEYEKIRNPIKYEEIIGIVSQLYQLRREKGRQKPLIRIQSVKTSIKKENEFLKIWEPISDEILFLEYKDYSQEAGEKPQAAYRCPLLYQRLMIHWDGTVPMCINDEYEDSVMGNILEKSVHEIWREGQFKEARDIHQKALRDRVYENCSRCALHRKGHGK